MKFVEIHAPWTDEQVVQLNRFQNLGVMHPFTCGWRERHPGEDGTLVATRLGWECPAPGCDYSQGWAHAAMADKDFLDTQEKFIENMRERAGLKTWYLATCQVCEPVAPQPFRNATERDEWTIAHTFATGHVVVDSEEVRKKSV